jgi:hypothetical protein
MSERARRPFRRTRWTAAVVAVALGATFLASPGANAADNEFENGTASAIAQSYKVNPTAASLSIGITFGLSLADYTNQVARAESRAIDLGIIGTTLASEPCDGGDPTLSSEKQPQPLRAESSDPKAAGGMSEQDKYAPVMTKSVRASNAPESEAQTTTIPLGQKGVLQMSGVKSDALTHIIDGKTREAKATVDVQSIDIAGAVHLGDLHWEALYRTGADTTKGGKFTIGEATVAGAPVAVPQGDPTPAFEAINTALAPLGIELRQPKAHENAGIVFIDPMTIAVVPSTTRDQLTGNVLNAAHPVRESLYDALLKQDCSNATYITVSDIVIGSITGSGSFEVLVGGGQATSGELKTTNFLKGFDTGGLPGLDDISGGPLGDSSGGSSVGSGALADSSSSSGLPSGDSSAGKASTPGNDNGNGGSEQAATPAASHRPLGKRGGALAAVGSLGLLLLLAMAEGDRRMMRRAQRMIPPEA